MQAFEYANPATLQEAFGLLSPAWGQSAVLAGGTDLLSQMKEYVATPKRVVNIKNIKELGGISKTAGGLRIGALATFDDLMNNAELRTEYPAIVTAVKGVTSPQVRNMGTVGGDLCIRPHCWYFRSGFGLLATQDGKPLVPDGENRYHAIFGNDKAQFVSASTLGPALVALGAKIKVQSASGSREIPAEKFFVTPASETDREIAIKANEIVTEVVLPPAAGVRNATYETREREMLDWPLATASVALKMSGNSVSSARVVMGFVAPTPWRAAKAEQALLRKTISEAVAQQAAEAAVEGATPLSQNGYKVQLARVAVKRALLAAARGKA